MDTERIKDLLEELDVEMEGLTPPESRVMRERIRDLEVLLILSWLWRCPLAGAKDLEGFVDLFSLSKIHSLLEKAVAAGFVLYVHYGKTYDVQRRFFLDLKGINRIRDHYRIPLEWQVTEEGLKRLVRRLRSAEAFYRILPKMWQYSVLKAPESFHKNPDPEDPPITLDDRMRLVGFQWVQRGSTHIVVWYQTTEGHEIWFPVHWYGFHHRDKTTRDEPIRDGLQGFSEGLETSSDYWTEAPASPPGLIIVAIDFLAALRAKLLYPPARDAVIITPETWVYQYMTPKCPMGSVKVLSDPPRTVGRPARVVESLETPEMSAMKGVTNRKLLEWVESWPGSREIDVAEGVGQPRSKTKEILEVLKVPLTNPSKPNAPPQYLVQVMEGRRLHLGTAGIKASSQRDRCSYQTAYGPLGSYLDATGHWRRNQMDHNRRVAKLAIRFQKGEGMFVAAGWRLVINYTAGPQLAPDMWVEVPWEDRRVVLHCVEYEQSAQSDSGVDKKLNNYRQAMTEMNEPWPMLMICKTKEAAERFGRRGDDLLMLVAAYDEVMDRKNHAFHGEESVWRYRGSRVDIDHLVGPYLDGRFRPRR